MLAQRIMTALVLLALLLPTLWVSNPWPFVLLTLVLISAAAWEWARLNGLPSAVALGCGLVLAAVGLWLTLTSRAAGESHAVWLLAALAWVIGGAFVLRAGPQRWAQWPQGMRVVVGAVLLVVAWWALAQARITGVNYLLSVLCIVWAADIAAYFGGRAFGRRKLAPTISPGKSWEGVVSGMLGVLVLAAFWLGLDTRISTDSASVFTLLNQRFGVFADGAGRAGAGGDERGGRSVRVPDQACGRRQGLQCVVARAWRRSGSCRCPAAGAAVRDGTHHMVTGSAKRQWRR